MVELFHVRDVFGVFGGFYECGMDTYGVAVVRAEKRGKEAEKSKHETIVTIQLPVEMGKNNRL